MYNSQYYQANKSKIQKYHKCISQTRKKKREVVGELQAKFGCVVQCKIPKARYEFQQKEVPQRAVFKVEKQVVIVRFD